MEPAKKTLYHSELVSLGAVTAVIQSDVTKSKYPGKPDFVKMQVGGLERQYWVENENCAEALRGRSGQTVAIQAHGSRDEATIDVSGATHSAPAQRSEPARQPSSPKPAENAAPAPASAPPAAKQATSKGTPLADAVHRAEQIANCNKIAVIKAHRVADELKTERGIELTREETWAIAMNIAIRMGYDGFHQQCPSGHMDTTPKAR